MSNNRHSYCTSIHQQGELSASSFLDHPSYHLWQAVTPCTRHIQISPSPHIPAFWQPSSCICHLLHVTHTSCHSHPRHCCCPPLCIHVSQHVTSMCHGFCHSHIGAWHLRICHSLLQSCYDSHHVFMWPDMHHTLRHAPCLHPPTLQLSSPHCSSNNTGWNSLCSNVAPCKLSLPTKK